MRKTKSIFYILIALYVVITLIFLVNKANLFDRFGILAFVNFVQVWLGLGAFFLVMEVVIERIAIRQLYQKINALEEELTRTKAKIYDMSTDGEKRGASLKSSEKQDNSQKDNDSF